MSMTAAEWRRREGRLRAARGVSLATADDPHAVELDPLAAALSQPAVSAPSPEPDDAGRLDAWLVRLDEEAPHRD